jgi:hypothetical protein
MATGPTPAQAVASGTNFIYIGGSSAAASAVLTYLEGAAFCGTNPWSEFDTDTTVAGYPDFRAVSCTVNGAAALAAGIPNAATTVYYRPEGGSVIGAFAAVNPVTISQLNIPVDCVAAPTVSGANDKYKCNVANAQIGAVSNVNGHNDSWPNTIKATLDIGVTDLEPPVFGNPTIAGTALSPYAANGHSDPVSAGAYSFLGADVSTDTLNSLTAAPVLQQVFGFIASSNLGITDLPKEEIANIFNGTITDWALVNKSNDTLPVTAAHTPIVVCNREIGSGTRAEADIYLTEDGCNGVGSVAPLKEVAGTKVVAGTTTITEPPDNYATLNEIDCVNANPNAIGYVSVDNFAKINATSAPDETNIVALFVTGSGTGGATAGTGFTSNLNQTAALGTYSDVYEAWVTEAGTASTNGQALYGLIAANVPVGGSVKDAHIDMIPNAGAGDTVTYPLTAYGAAPNITYVSEFTRSGNSCTPLAKQK